MRMRAYALRRDLLQTLGGVSVMEKSRCTASLLTGQRAAPWLLASIVVVGVLMVTAGAASATQRSDGSVACSLSGTVTFSPPLTTSGGGTHSSRISATLSNCTDNSGIVELF
ncbi:MAG TPA: hypothetical protein VID75_15910, partial [Acidimicrobiales bacterium]